MGLLGLFSKKKAAAKQELKREQDPNKVQPKTNIAESNGVWWNTSNQIDLGADKALHSGRTRRKAFRSLDTIRGDHT